MLLAKSLALAAPGSGPHASLQAPYDVIKVPTEVWIPLPFGYPGRRPGSGPPDPHSRACLNWLQFLK